MQSVRNVGTEYQVPVLLQDETRELKEQVQRGVLTTGPTDENGSSLSIDPFAKFFDKFFVL